MTQSQGDDLFDGPVDDYEQDGPDLFGLSSGEVVAPHDAIGAQPIAVDVEEDEMDEIPIDPTDEPENQVTPAELAAVQGSELDDQVDAQAALTTSEGEPEREAPLALYRRYRPDTFAEVIGQEHVTEPLQRALANNRVNHAYLFSGPRGCGKTTSARILARCLNCEQGPTPTPCGVCQSCRDLARGGSGSIDVIEIDAASHGGVNEARDLRERAFFAPVHSRYKIYIIDEAHMVTKEGFNALLKLVEEPPPHVKFIFATTEPEKVLGTIRSRTHHYPFRLVPAKTLSTYLQRLCDAEGVRVDAAALPLVVRAGAGSVRDSLSVLDQLLGGAEDGGVTYQQATALLGYTPDSLLDEIVDAFAAGDAQGVFACIDKVIEVGQDPRRFAEDLLRRLRDLIIVAAVPDALTSGLVEVAGDQADRLAMQAQGLGAGELTRAAEVIAQGLTDMRGTTAPRLYLELMCSRVLLPAADADGRGVHARLDRLERRLNMVGQAGEPEAGSLTPARAETPMRVEAVEAPAGTAPGEGAAAARNAARAARAEVHTAVPAQPEGSDLSASPSPAQPIPQPARRSDADPAPESRGEASAPPPAASPDPQGPASVAAGQLDTAGLRAMWPQVLDAVKRRRRVTWIVLSQNAQVASLSDGVLTLAMKSAGARESFGRGGSPDVLRESIIEVVGIAPEIATVVGEGDPVPPVIPSRPIAPQTAPETFRPAARPEPVSAAPLREDAASGESAESRTPRAPDSSSPEPSQQDAEVSSTPPVPPVQAATAARPPAEVPRPAPAAPHDDEPPPDDEDEYERPNFAELARANLHKPAQEAQETVAEQSRDDVDLSDAANVDDLLRRELGAELIADETAS